MKVAKKPVTNGYRLQNGYKGGAGEEKEMKSRRNGELKKKTMTSGFFSRWSGAHKDMVMRIL
jgi:hypothetical protein